MRRKREEFGRGCDECPGRGFMLLAIRLRSSGFRTAAVSLSPGGAKMGAEAKLIREGAAIFEHVGSAVEHLKKQNKRARRN